MRRKKSFTLLPILLFLFLFSFPALAVDHLYPAQVKRVIDGDTIEVDLYLGLGVVLNNQLIGLYGIDAWETSGEERERGLKAKEYQAKRLAEGAAEIEIKPEWGRRGEEEYGRWLGVVEVDGASINAELVAKGHAEEYEDNPDDTKGGADMNDIWQVLKQIGPLMAGIGALVAAVIALFAIRTTNKSIQAQVIVEMRERYGSAGMLRDMMKLLKWKKEWGEDFAKVFGEKRRQNYEGIRLVDEARRRFSHHFGMISVLLKHRLISRKVERDLRTKGQRRFYKNVVKPLEEQIEMEG